MMICFPFRHIARRQAREDLLADLRGPAFAEKVEKPRSQARIRRATSRPLVARVILVSDEAFPFFQRKRATGYGQANLHAQACCN